MYLGIYIYIAGGRARAVWRAAAAGESMCIYTCVYIYICIYVYMYICISVYIYIRMRICLYRYIEVWI